MSLLRIGKRLSYLRKKVGLSLDQAGAGILSSTHLSNIENGRFYPSEDILILLARKYDVPEDYLLWYEKRDASIDQPLRELLYLIFTDLKKAKEIVDSIDQKGYISNIEQETLFIILKTCFLIKSGKSYEESFSLVKHYVTEGDISYPSYIHQCYVYLLGLHFFEVKDYENSRKYFQILDRYDLPVKIKAIIEFNLLILLHHLNKRVHAVLHAEKSLELFFKHHLWEFIAETYNVLMVSFWRESDLDTALEYASKALEIVNTHKLTEVKSRLLHNFGVIYKAKKDFNKALKYFEESVKIKKELGLNISGTVWSILEIYSLQKNSDKFYSLIKSIDHARNDYILLELKLNPEIIPKSTDKLIELANNFEENTKFQNAYEIYKELAKYYYKNRKYKLAAQYYQKEIKIYKKLKGDVF